MQLLYVQSLIAISHILSFYGQGQVTAVPDVIH